MIQHSRAAAASRADLAALLVVTIWGTNFVFQKAALAEWQPLAFLFMRFVGMLLLAWGVLLWRRRTSGAPIGVARGDLGRLALAGLLGYSLYIGLSTLGLSYTTAFSSALLIATAPVFTLLLLAALRLERIAARQVLGLAGALLGVLLFLAEKGLGGLASARLGDGLNLLAAFCFAAYTVANKPLLERYAAPVVTAYTMALGVLPVMLLALPALAAQDWGRISLAGWGTLLWGIVFPVYVAWTIWSWVGARIGVGRTSLYMYLVPVIGGITAWLLLGESFSPLKLLGALLTLASVALARRVPVQSTRSTATASDVRPQSLRSSP